MKRKNVKKINDPLFKKTELTNMENINSKGAGGETYVYLDGDYWFEYDGHIVTYEYLPA